MSAAGDPIVGILVGTDTYGWPEVDVEWQPSPTMALAATSSLPAQLPADPTYFLIGADTYGWPEADDIWQPTSPNAAMALSLVAAPAPSVMPVAPFSQTQFFGREEVDTRRR